jgi:hypothetical protein
VDRKSLVPTETQGQRIQPVPSSYAARVPLEKTVSIEQYLSHDVRAVYQVSSDADLGPLLEELKSGTIYQFPYSFRGGLEPDAAFLLLAADGTPFIAIGTPTQLEFVGFDQSLALVGEEEGEDEDEMDFAMM